MRVKLDGFLSRDFAGEMAPPMDLGLAPGEDYVSEEVDIVDARPLQGCAASEAEFFAQHGFVLMTHKTQIRDWDRQLASVYVSEAVALIQDRILPERRIEIVRGSMALKRGPNERYYATRIHADGPLTSEGYALNVGAVGGDHANHQWRAHYAREDVAGFMSIGFWRTTGMRRPLQHMPIAMCDPNRVDPRDVVPTTSTTIAPAGRTTHHLVLRHDPAQAWYYYPHITGEELVAMKACEFWKDDPPAHPQNVFHAAFDDPTTPPDAERRQSFDHRIGVMILRD